MTTKPLRFELVEVAADEKGYEVVKPSPTTPRAKVPPIFHAFMRDMAKAVFGKPKGVLAANRTPVVKTVKQSKAPKAVSKRKGKTKTKGRGIVDRVKDYRVGDAIEDGVKAWSFIKKYLNVEEKMFDTQVAATTITWSGTVFNLSNIAEGDDYLNREGDSVLCQKLSLRGFVYGNNTPAQNQQPVVMRIMVLRDMLQTAGTDPAPADIVETAVLGGILAPFAFIAHKHDGMNPQARRFRILKDELVSLEPKFATTIETTGTGTVDLVGIPHQNFVWNLSVDAHATFSSTAGADASNWVGALYLFAVSNIQTNGPQLLYESRLYFTDN